MKGEVIKRIITEKQRLRCGKTPCIGGAANPPPILRARLMNKKEKIRTKIER